MGHENPTWQKTYYSSTLVPFSVALWIMCTTAQVDQAADLNHWRSAKSSDCLCLGLLMYQIYAFHQNNRQPFVRAEFLKPAVAVNLKPPRRFGDSRKSEFFGPCPDHR